MLTSDLEDHVLTNPVQERGCDKLLVISGYASANHTLKHFERVKNRNISVDLVIGMAKNDGIGLDQHLMFVSLCKNGAYGCTLECSYIFKRSPVHAKIYIWLKEEHPVIAFLGSANYSENAFGGLVRESVVEVEPQQAFEYFNSIKSDSCSCLDTDVYRKVKIFEKEYRGNRGVLDPAASIFRSDSYPSVELSLLARTGKVPAKSGLNWGQRAKRNPDQAYIAIPSEIYSFTSFFPEIGKKFCVTTDDSRSFLMVRAQQKGKALHTTDDNSMLGRYFRERLGVASGEFVLRDHLVNYGRTNVKFVKIDEETYFMDFSVDGEQNSGGNEI